MKYCEKNGHCWHSNGTILTCDPPIHEEVCCHCGEQRSRRENRIPDIAHHGKYHPEKVYFNLEEKQ